MSQTAEMQKGGKMGTANDYTHTDGEGKSVTYNSPIQSTKSDLIDRQAAIDALKEVSEHYTDKGREWHPHVNFMVQAIEELPSAQPETAKRTAESVQNVPKDELISRKAAIEVIDAVFPVDPMKSEYAQGVACGAALAKIYVEQLPTAELQWIPCKESRSGQE